MLKIVKNKISLTRGDSAYIAIGINDLDGTPYELQDGDVVQCQIRTAPNTGALLVDASTTNEKIYKDEDGVVMWHIIPADTRELEVGTYYYDIQLVTPAGDVFTFIESAVFNVTDEVTRT